ncbi:hypothetical protein KL905_003744 [Ogataea polymorpha]|nr:hypothetical protein KL908_004816 [Ogataea polymorpha]KAG7898391.1 hypothetical protein KL907_005291 [Ogataea polymorpha]KAG7905100.1 hypothetical protein KL906_005391 [Ogataea polymorpha]KAG7918733.1 hypothetical protein KL905_003744 [Ogataea polymorpha]KAG7921265.1 hypothetical protein KL927_000509 [Ogataea polymorpha]
MLAPWPHEARAVPCCPPASKHGCYALRAPTQKSVIGEKIIFQTIIMFARQARNTARSGIRSVGVRPISQYITKAQGKWTFAPTILTTREGLAPPSVAEIQQVYQGLYKKALEFAAQPKTSADGLIKVAKSLSKEEYLRFGAYFIQIVGLFSLGEIIGRRQIVGYPSFGPKEHHH